jgi:hypothetical protein
MQVTTEHGRSALVFQTSILAMSRAASTAKPVANGASYPGMPVESCARHVLDICGIDRITPSDPNGIFVLSLAHGYLQVCLALRR